MPNQRCKDCGQPVKWVKTQAGKWIPLLPSPDPDGTFVLRKFIGVDGEKETRAVSLDRRSQQLAREQGDMLWAAHASACTAVPKAVPKGMPEHVRQMLEHRKAQKRGRHVG
ncbi:hypothetical protein WG936_08115 [Corynebacterium sp. H127]|uniref:hypothetical protein n=1 Tax=Corynebacterium sp. H127 TaxID=3133418 RepID=UPI0030B08DF4